MARQTLAQEILDERAERYARAYVLEGTLRKAAARMNVSKSAIHKGLQKLHRESLGTAELRQNCTRLTERNLEMRAFRGGEATRKVFAWVLPKDRLHVDLRKEDWDLLKMHYACQITMRYPSIPKQIYEVFVNGMRVGHVFCRDCKHTGRAEYQTSYAQIEMSEEVEEDVH